MSSAVFVLTIQSFSSPLFLRERAMILELLPRHILLDTVKKVDAVTLCRLRQTCRGIDKFVEDHRFRIAAPFKNRTIGLTVTVDDSEPICHFYVRVVKTEMQICYSMTYYGFPEGRKTISDPDRQLSGIKFYRITVAFPMAFYHEDVQPYTESIQKHLSLFNKGILPVLQRIRLQTDILNISLCPEKRLCPLIESVRFSRLFVMQSNGLSVRMDDLLQWPTQHVVERHLGYLSDEIRCLGPLVRSYKNATLLINSETSIEHLLIDFFQEIRDDHRAKGNLEFLYLFGTARTRIGNLEMGRIPGIERLWRGAPRGCYCEWHTLNDMVSFYKIDVPRGAVIIAHYDKIVMDFFVFFREQNDREDLFSVVAPLMFPGFAIDFSSVYDDFLNAASEQEAVERLAQIPVHIE